MSLEPQPATRPADVGTDDWRGIARSAPYQSLISQRRRIVVPFAAAAFAFVVIFAVLAGWAGDTMGTSLGGGWNIGLLLALAQLAVVWLLGYGYLRYSGRVLDPLRQQVIDDAGRDEVAR